MSKATAGCDHCHGAGMRPVGVGPESWGQWRPCPSCRKPGPPQAEPVTAAGLKRLGFGPKDADDAIWWHGPVSVIVYPADSISVWMVDGERIPPRLRPATMAGVRQLLSDCGQPI